MDGDEVEPRMDANTRELLWAQCHPRFVVSGFGLSDKIARNVAQPSRL